MYLKCLLCLTTIAILISPFKVNAQNLNSPVVSSPVVSSTASENTSEIDAQVLNTTVLQNSSEPSENSLKVSVEASYQEVSADLNPTLSLKTDTFSSVDPSASLSLASPEILPQLLDQSEDTSETVANAVAQDPGAPSEIGGQPPSLQTEPTSPDQKPFVPQTNLVKSSGRYSPSITLLTPSGYGKSWGQVSVGGSFQSRARYVNEADAAFGFGFGLGDAKKSVGLDVNFFVADITSFSRGGVGFKLHHQFPNQLAIAAGVNNALTWGDIDGGISPFGVVTKGFQLRDDVRAPFSQLYVSGGAGTGRYRSESDVANRRDTVGVFGSVALRVVQPVNFIAEWSGQDLSLGFSILPFPKLPIVLSPMVTDVTGSAGDGPRFAFAVGMGFNF
jgi:hypothetical protein